MLPSIFVVLLILLPIPQAQNPQPAGGVRPCASSWNTPPESGKKRSKNGAELQQSQPGACFEVGSSALEIQEYLQAFTRQHEWKTSGEHLGEDSWAFTRELSKDELVQFIKRSPDTDRIEWTNGVGFLRVNSVALGNGFTRTVIRASFRGFGESADKFATQKKYWELESNGALEESMASALRSHFQTGSRAVP
jgi:hypothetical protein